MSLGGLGWLLKKQTNIKYSAYTFRVIVLLTPQAKLLRKLVCHCLFRCPFISLTVGLIFYDTKVTVMNRVLNATVQRTADHAAPEITLDPLEIVGGLLLSHLP